MTELEVLETISHLLKLIANDMGIISAVLVLILMFKNMGGK